MSKQNKVILDIDAVLDFIFSPNEKRTTDINLEEVYGKEVYEDEDGEETVRNKQDLSLIQKIRRETKNGEHSQHEAIRLDLFSRLYESVGDLDVEGGSVLKSDLNFSEEIAYNTLFHYGFLKTV